MEVEISTWYAMKQAFLTYIPFPADLFLHNIPQTVMVCYSDNEKDSLLLDTKISKMTTSTSSSGSTNATMIEQGFVRMIFATGDNDDVQAFINVMRKTPNNLRRNVTDQICKGCRKFGHDIFTQGCNFCAQLSIPLRFLEKYPVEMMRVIKEYMTFQKKCQTSRNNCNNRRKDKQ